MASRPAVPLQRFRGKQNNVPAEGSSRQVLQDIGNLVAKRAVEGKLHARSLSLSCKVTCSSNNSLPCRTLANAQAAAEKNKKPITEAVASNGVGVAKGHAATKVVAPPKNVLTKPNPEEVLMISLDEEDEGKRAGVRKARGSNILVIWLLRELWKGSFMQSLSLSHAKSLARSKAACGLSNKPKDPIEHRYG